MVERYSLRDGCVRSMRRGIGHCSRTTDCFLCRVMTIMEVRLCGPWRIDSYSVSIFSRFEFRDPASLARYIVGRMPCKRAKQGSATAEPAICTETSTSNRRRNKTGAAAATGAKPNTGTCLSNRTKNNTSTTAAGRTRKDTETSGLGRTQNNTETSTSSRTPNVNQTTTTNETFSNNEDRFVLLRDEQTSRHVMFRRDQLSCSKKDDFKTGSYATFHGDGDLSTRCRGIIVLAGKTKQCRGQFVLSFV